MRLFDKVLIRVDKVLTRIARWRERRHKRWLRNNRVILPKPDGAILRQADKDRERINQGRGRFVP